MTKQMEKALKKLEKLDKKQDYGCPEPYKPKLGQNPTLIYGAKDWCILLSEDKKPYAVFKDGMSGLSVREL